MADTKKKKATEAEELERNYDVGGGMVPDPGVMEPIPTSYDTAVPEIPPAVPGDPMGAITPLGAEYTPEATDTRRRLAGGAKALAASNLPDLTGPLAMPLRAALIGAAGGFQAPPPKPVAEVGVVGNVAPIVTSTMDAAGDVVGNYASERASEAQTLLFGRPAEKEQRRAAESAHAHDASGNARIDPSAGTSQGAGQETYKGTGTTKSATGATGGVTTGEPGRIRVDVPGRGMVDYDPDDPTVAEAFAQQRGGGRDSFMEHSQRAPASRVGQIRRSPSVLGDNMRAQGGRIVGPEGSSGRHK
jgi:hypothetical protein